MLILANSESTRFKVSRSKWFLMMLYQLGNTSMSIKTSKISLMEWKLNFVMRIVPKTTTCAYKSKRTSSKTTSRRSVLKIKNIYLKKVLKALHTDRPLSVINRGQTG